ncbi:transcription antitermination factor NusB [bacterium]|nr:transcription antitermination factor NusB [bacterium]
MGHRRQSREIALQLLYQLEFESKKPKEALDGYWTQHAETPHDVREFADILLEGTTRNLKEIDGFIEGTSTNWKLSRMASVDRNILRIASYELLFLEDIPASVTINEAVEIAKKFGTEESSGFINGILDKIAKHAPH